MSKIATMLDAARSGVTSCALSPDFGTDFGTIRCELRIRLLQLIDEVIIPSRGEMAEWSKAPDSKSGLGQPNGGSNPSLSAILVIPPYLNLAAVGLPNRLMAIRIRE